MRFLFYLYAFLAIVIVATNTIVWIAPSGIFDTDWVFAWVFLWMLSFGSIFTWISHGELLKVNAPSLSGFNVLVVYATLETACNLAVPNTRAVVVYHGAPETLAFFCALSLTGAVALMLAAIHLRRQYRRPNLTFSIRL